MKINSVRFLTFAAILGAVCASQAQVVYMIDFNEQRNSAGFPDPSLSWNVFDAPSDMTGTLVDTTGAASAYTIGQTGLNDSGYPTYNNTGPAWAYDAVELAAGAVDDFFWTTNTAESTATVTIGGLDGVDFDLNLIAGGKNHSAYSEQYFSYSLDGGSTWTGFDIYNSDGSLHQPDSLFNYVFGYTAQAGRELVATGLTLATGDSLVIRSTDPETSASCWNALQLTVVPEPSVAAILLGVAAFVTVLSSRPRRG